MATDRERLHVAAMLYDEAAGFRNLCEKYDNEWTIDLGDVPAAFQDIAHYLGFDGVVRADALFERLAELIDPTCHMVDTDHEYEDSIRCDVCQMTFNRPWEPFKFCPNCGARVVSDDG